MAEQYIIPVAFEIYADSEEEAAKYLVKKLSAAYLQDRQLDSWWMPNHPYADGSDSKGVEKLAWIEGEPL